MIKVVKQDLTRDGNSKDLAQWFRLASTVELIQEYNSEAGCESTTSYYSITDGPIDLRGTYCHRLLVPHIASWCSAKFAIRVSKLVNQ